MPFENSIPLNYFNAEWLNYENYKITELQKHTEKKNYEIEHIITKSGLENVEIVENWENEQMLSSD